MSDEASGTGRGPRIVGLSVALLVPLGLILSVGADPGVTPREPEGRDNSPAAIHQRIMVLDGALEKPAAPCVSADAASAWSRTGLDAGIWWARDDADIAAVECWMLAQRGTIRLATRAGDAPALHTAGTRSIYIGVERASREQLAQLYRSGVRFARAPRENALPWLLEARRLGITADVSQVPEAILLDLLSRDGPPFLYGWQRATGSAPSPALIRLLADRRDGVLLMLSSPGAPVGVQDLLLCLRSTSWEHCAVGGAARPEELSTKLLSAGYTEGNLARIYGFNLLRVLRKTEVWSGQR